jgi:hypothetical protein
MRCLLANPEPSASGPSAEVGPRRSNSPFSGLELTKIAAGSEVSLWTDSVAKIPKGAAANFPPKNEKERQSPINRASNPLPESPVSLAHGDVVPHIIIRSSRLGPENLSPMPKKNFCNTIGPKADATALRN